MSEQDRQVDATVKYTKVNGGYKVTATVKMDEFSASYFVKAYGHNRAAVQQARDEAVKNATEAVAWLSCAAEETTIVRQDVAA